MTTATHARSVAGAVPVRERILAPDLARGFALLLVALAHATGILNGTIPRVDPDPQGPERAYYFVMFTFVHASALPLFAMLFGYGLVQFMRHQDERQVPPEKTRAALLRRHAGLLLLGVLHGILLFVGDVLGAFGIGGLILTLLVLRRGKWVYRLGLVYLGFGLVYLAVLAARVYPSMSGNSTTKVPTGQDTTATAVTYADSVKDRLTDWPISTLVLLSTILFAMIGVWAARQRILEEPAKHRKLLWSGAIGGFAIAIAGTLPTALTAAGVAGPEQSLAGASKQLYEGAGLFGSVGYICVFGLIGLRLANRQRTGRVAGALVALGQRTLTFYLLQSVCWQLLLSHYLLRLGERTNSPAYTALACALGIWLVSLVLASVLQRFGYRGPAERLIRWFTHGSNRR
ncbi:DUF418 domain-containing protein [Kribbella solani]|uniref:DUF418 domain-containing protein n=1 Tax=Kribbella solani TaxID=236067 RepID=UPI0029A6A668|nr:DUF418 domain-containing protein [Kribbella solani]MDX3006195.1 DUF418 domain-containing protein [Kribbella solani]